MNSRPMNRVERRFVNNDVCAQIMFSSNKRSVLDSCRGGVRLNDGIEKALSANSCLKIC